MSTTIKTQGITITWNAVELGEVTGFSGLSSPATLIPITSFSDTVKKFRPGRRKSGTFVAKMNFNSDNTVQTAVETDRVAGTSRTVTVVFPEGTTTTLTFTARAMGITITGNNNGIYTGEFTFKITSTIVES